MLLLEVEPSLLEDDLYAVAGSGFNVAGDWKEIRALLLDGDWKGRCCYRISWMMIWTLLEDDPYAVARR